MSRMGPGSSEEKGVGCCAGAHTDGMALHQWAATVGYSKPQRPPRTVLQHSGSSQPCSSSALPPPAQQSTWTAQKVTVTVKHTTHKCSGEDLFFFFFFKLTVQQYSQHQHIYGNHLKWCLLWKFCLLQNFWIFNNVNSVLLYIYNCPNKTQDGSSDLTLGRLYSLLPIYQVTYCRVSKKFPT